MLEFSNKYCTKEVTDLKDFITVVYILIDDIYQEITPTYIKERRNIKDAILSDSEIITISIVGELLTIDSEKAWLEFCRKNLKDLFPKFCSRTRFNRTRRALHSVKENILVNMDSQVPNEVVFQALTKNKINGLEGLTSLKREVTFENSRYDIYFESESQRGFIEVKGVTLENNGISIFPDAPTERGAKHVLEMIEAIKQGCQGIILFLIQMKGPTVFGLNWQMDSKFSEAVKLASENGVEIFAYDSIVTNNSIEIGKPVEIYLVSKS